jgi:hypothetical protein
VIFKLGRFKNVGKNLLTYIEEKWEPGALWYILSGKVFVLYST